MSARPFAITAVCVLGVLAACYTAVLLLSPGLWVVAPTTAQRAAGLAAVLFAVVSLYGMWRMRRWGVVLLGVALAARVAYGLLVRQPGSWAPLAGPALALVVGLLYLRKMT